MLKILRTVPFFAPAFGHGGPVIHTFNISKIQVSLGYDVRIFTTNISSDNISSKTLQEYEILNGIKIHRFPVKLRFGHYFITPHLPANLLKYDYDIIHSHSYRTFQTDMATIFSKLKKKPFVLTAHGTLRNMYMLNLFLTKKKAASRMKYYDYFVKKNFLKTVDRVIVHSKHEKSWTLKYNVPEEKIKVIPHGVNLENFSNILYKRNFIKKFNLKNKMILYVGRLFRNYRNLDHLIKVMNDIIKEIKDVKLWFIGYSFDKEYEQELRKMVKELKLSNYINFLTHPTREDIFGAYQAASVKVFPITESDGFGIPLIEAGAAKCPVISTNRGPAPEIVKDGKTGILTPVNDLSQLKKAILKIITNDELRTKMGLNGYENVLKNYTWEVITKKNNEVYDELI